MTIIRIGHYTYDTDKDEFYCTICGFRTVDEDEIISHMKVEHGK